jgi:hypothetical protein
MSKTIKRTSLEDLVSRSVRALLAATPVKPQPAAAPQKPSRREKVKGTQPVSVYPPLAAYEQLRQLAHDERRKMHDYMIEGLDLVFRQKGLPSIAELKARGGDA